MKIAILDDEKHCVESLRFYMENAFPEFEIIHKSTNPAESVHALKNIEVDLLFLDVEMPGMNGFDFLDEFAELPFDVIFTTAYSQYAIQAFRAQAVNYLLKPIEEKELVEAIEHYRGKELSRLDRQNEIKRLLEAVKRSVTLKNKISIPTSKGLEFIEVDEIVYCQSQSNYTTFHMKDGKSLIISRTLKEVEKLLEKFFFVRVHQSYLINPNYLKRYHRNDGGYLVLYNDQHIPISNAKRSVVIEIFENLQGT